jgi:Ran GTPase-activating protein (RanGAP) involved in mRNA processing and transport
MQTASDSNQKPLNPAELAASVAQQLSSQNGDKLAGSNQPGDDASDSSSPVSMRLDPAGEFAGLERFLYPECSGPNVRNGLVTFGFKDSSYVVDTASTHVRVSGKRIDDADVIKLSLSLSLTTYVTNIDLSSNSIGKEGATALRDALSSNPRTVKLNMEHNGLGPAGLVALSSIVRVPSLQTLLLSGNRIVSIASGSGNTDSAANASATDLSGMVKFCAELTGPGVTLTELNLSSNNLGPDGGRLVGDMLKLNSTLVKLSLAGPDQNLGAQGVRFLSLGLEKNAHLTDLSLAKNGCGSAGIFSLLDALVANPALISLNMQANLIDSVAVSDIFKFIDGAFGKPFMQKLDLRHNDLGVSFSKDMKARLAKLPAASVTIIHS